MMDAAYAPPGWPETVRPPGAPDWQATATAYLFDCCPPDFRRYPVLRRHPAVLARFAGVFVAAQQNAAERGLAEVRTSLRDRVDPSVIGEAVDAWSEQQARLARTRRAVGLLEEALLGRVFVQRLADGPSRRRHTEAP
jgi:hypothetical protein